jgi:hypothetical protein
MVRVKTIVIFALVAIIGIFTVVYFFQSEKSKVKKRFRLLAELVSKEPGENRLNRALKIKKTRTLFSENCELKTHIPSTSGDYSPQEISTLAASALSRFSRLSLRFYDLDIDIQKGDIAKVTFTATLTGKMIGEEDFDETYELESVLHKVQDSWLFKSLEVIEVLKK